MMKHKRLLSVILALVLASGSMLMPMRAEGFGIKGDVNQDGTFNVSDIVLLQKWLLAVPDTHLANWKSADFCADGKLDVFDLTLMKRELINSTQNTQSALITSPVCKSAAFACLEDETLLYYDNIDARVAPASLTKLLTASVALHYLSPDTIITVGSEQKLVKSGSSLCLIRQGHKLKLYDLLTGMLMASGNDAAYTVAVATARSVKSDVQMSDSEAVQYFSELMNSYASEIGMKNSHFVNPEGWDADNQYTTVSDLLVLAQYAFSVPEIRTITGTYQKNVVFASGENITWTNSNALLNPNSSYYSTDAIGMKTGTTSDAGSCLIAAFERNNKTYLSAVVGCNTNADRYELTLKLLSNCTSENTSKSNTTVPNNSNTKQSDIFEKLNALTYIPVTCDGLPEYELVADDGTVYQLNFSSKWVWRNGCEEAVLSDDMISWLNENKDSVNLLPIEW